MSDEPFLLKDHLFNAETIGVVADAVAGVHRQFDRKAFIASVFDEHWEDRALKQRLRHVAECLHAGLPASYPEAVAILRRASPATSGAGFAAMAFSEYVEAYGVDDYETSIPALEEFTKVVSAEFAVRPFLLKYPDRMISQMATWAEHPDEQVRRLATEGSRPRLPWGMALKPFQVDPSPVLPILERLRDDPSEDVRRSVANNLNDISRDHPDLVIRTLERWQDGSPEIAGITNHALRTLLKQGHPDALGLLGFGETPRVRLESLRVDPDPVPVGAKTTVRFDLVSEADREQNLMIDGVVEYARPRKPASKVFKWKTATVAPGERISVKRSVTLQQLSTRRIHPGRHAVDVQVNGKRMGRVEFEVSET